MPIEFHCDHCGKLVRAPDETAGKRGRCPSCHQSVYIPTPSDQLEPLAIAPSDAGDDQEQERLLRESRELATRLAADQESGAVSGDPPPSVADDVLPPRLDMETLVIEYAKAMAAGDLPSAEEMASEIRKNMPAAEDVMQRLTIDELPPAQLADIPRPVLVGFFKQLREKK